MATTTTATSNQPKDRQHKRVRPPDLSLDPKKITTNVSVQIDSPSTGADSPSSVTNSPIDGIPGYDETEDELGKDLAILEKLRQNVQKNLRLRPLNSSALIRNRTPNSPTLRGNPLHTAPVWYDISRPLSNEFVASPTSTTSSVYYTPTSDTPMSAYFGFPRGQSTASGHFSPPSTFHTFPQKPGAIQYHSLHFLISENPRPLLIDTRPLNTFLLSHLRHSVNVAIPSLILKRFRKPGAGLQSIDALRQYITTDRGKKLWDDTVKGSDWDGNVVVYDEDMDEKHRSAMQTTAWALLPVLRQMVSSGTVEYLQGGLSSARADPSTQNLFMSGDSDTPLEQRQFKSKKGAGLSQLDTLAASRSKQLPQIEFDTPQSPIPIAAPVPSPAPTPTPPLILSPSRSWTMSSIDIDTSSPSPPPRQVSKRPSVPSLRKIDTQSIERQPKLSLKTQFSKSATHLTGPPKPWNVSRPSPLNIPPPSPSPSHINLTFPSSISNSLRATMGSQHLTVDRPTTPSNGLLSVTPTHSRPGTPRTPTTPLPPSPMTARQEDLDPPTTEEAFPVFAVSTILPNFLFLGPELTAEDHVQELLTLGVKRILNIAAECDDDQGLRLKKRFGYTKIPMRDFVEEENIRKGIRNVCDILGDFTFAIHRQRSHRLTHSQTMPDCILAPRISTAKLASLGA